MRKVILLILLILLVVVQGQIFAQTSADSNSNYAELPLSFSLPGSFTTMNMDKQLPSSYYGNIPSWLAAAGNLFFGFGIGSFIQGDTLGGFVGLGGDVVGGIFFILPWTGLYGNANIAGVSLIGGLAILTASRIFQSARPFWYDFNGRLSLITSARNNGELAYGIAYTLKF